MKSAATKSAATKFELNKFALIFVVMIFAPGISPAMKEMKSDSDAVVAKLAASATAMNCQVFSSDYQDVSILDLHDGSFALRTLDQSGSRAFFELTAKEWPASRVKIPCWLAPHAVCGEMIVNLKNGWEYALTGASGVAEGNCQ